MSEEKTIYKATRIVHCPNGPVAACEGHAGKLISLFSFLGTHVGHELASDIDECVNCINEAKTRGEVSHG